MFSAFILSISESISHMNLHKNITRYTLQSNDLTTKLTKLFETYSVIYCDNDSAIIEDLKRISGLLFYLKSCIYILESGQFDRWKGFRNNDKARYVNRIKVISTEVEEIINIIDRDIHLCKTEIKKFKLYPLKRTKAYSL